MPITKTPFTLFEPHQQWLVSCSSHHPNTITASEGGDHERSTAAFPLSHADDFMVRRLRHNERIDISNSK